MTRFKHMRILRTLGRGLGFLLLMGAGSTLIPGCGVGYVVRSAYFQAELLSARKPIEKVRGTEELSASQLKSLDRIADIKTFGAELGLKATDNYSSIAWGWDRTIWNLSACQPLSFRSRVWRFPIVGTVPYLGFFRTQDAEQMRGRLERQGYEVYIRSAGAYSTLGWFRDPILVPMLDWNRFRLADTVLHELAHATLWIPGSVKFNESFANFVGEAAAFQYLKTRHGENAKVVVRAREDKEDMGVWRVLMHRLYQDLEAVYSDPMLSDADKRTRKAALFTALPDRVRASDFHDPKRFAQAAEAGPWNNARVAQYRTYNHKREWFRAVFEQNNADLLAFIQAIDEITAGQQDPFKALKAAAAVDEM